MLQELAPLSYFTTKKVNYQYNVKLHSACSARLSMIGDITAPVDRVQSRERVMYVIDIRHFIFHFVDILCEFYLYS